MDVDIVGPSPGRHQQSSTPLLLTPQKTPAQPAIFTPTARPGLTTSNILAPSPTLSPLDLRPPTPAASKPSTPVSIVYTTPQFPSQLLSGHGSTVPQTGSLFALPYRLLFAVVTMDTVAIYDTQQASPICLLTKLHYDEFTDMSW
jgi:chromatin assembly factor 1 subunit B